MTAARGQLVIASDADHFGPGATGEDLSRLSVLSDAQSAKSAQGPIDYRETPNSPLEHAAYARVTSAAPLVTGLTVFAQTPATRVRAVLEPLAWALAAAAAASSR